MNSMLEEGLLSAAGDSTLSSLAPAVVLVPMLNLSHAPDMLQLAAMLVGHVMAGKPVGQRLGIEGSNPLTAPGSIITASGHPDLQRPRASKAIRPAHIVVLSV